MVSRGKDLAFWKMKFKSLEGWDIDFDKTSRYKGQCSFDLDKKKATIYGFQGKMPSDYLLHELLHIAFKTNEEQFIRDICKMMKGGFDVER